MNRPKIELVAFVELEVDEIGDLDHSAARASLQFVNPMHGRAMVVVHGVLRIVSPAVVRLIGGALYDAETVDVLCNGPAAVAFAQGIAEAAGVERGFHHPGAA